LFIEKTRSFLFVAIALTNGGILRLTIVANVDVNQQLNEINDELEQAAEIGEFEAIDAPNEEAELAAAIKASLEEEEEANKNKKKNVVVDENDDDDDDDDNDENPLSALRDLLLGDKNNK
jgi:hypothetical protein